MLAQLAMTVTLNLFVLRNFTSRDDFSPHEVNQRGHLTNMFTMIHVCIYL